MREILFRGKRKDNGEWASATSIFKAECAGDLRFYINSLSDATVYFNSDGNITRTETELDCEWLEVIQETVGQFTGLTDKNGKKIFEGDILKRTNGNKYLWYVDFKLSAFCANQSNCNYACELGELLEMIELEVIGNIHDNPELLEEGDS